MPIKKVNMNTTSKWKDQLITFLMTFMIMSFYLFELKWWGRYVIFGITLFITLIYASKNSWKISIRFGSFHYHIILFVIYCFISALWAWEPSAAISKGITIGLILMCFTFLYAYYQTANYVINLLKAIMYAGYGVAIYTLLFYGPSLLLHMVIGNVRLGNDYANANSLGMVAAISCIIQLYFILEHKHDASVVFIIPAVLVLAASQSRKAMVLLLLGIIMLYLLNMKGKKLPSKILKFILGVVVIILLCYLISKINLFQGVFERFETYFESLSGERGENIRDIYREIGMEQFKKTPVVGIGIGNSAALLQSCGQRRTYLHDNFVELLSCGGIIGFFIFYSMYVDLFISILKYRRANDNLSNLIIILIALMLFMDYGMVSYFDKQQYVYFMCFFLYSENLKRINEQIKLLKSSKGVIDASD
jgi:hypothetical protein